MKLYFAFFSLLFSFNLFSQHCGNSGPSVCTPTGLPSGQAITDYNTFPCIKRNVPYSESLQIWLPDSLNQFGLMLDLISFKIDSIKGLPCNMCWQCNKSNFTYPSNTNACIKITGTTSDAEGVYKLVVHGMAETNNGTFYGTLDVIGIHFYLNVVGTNENCGPINITQLNSPCDTSMANSWEKCDMDFNFQLPTSTGNCNLGSSTITLMEPSGPNFGCLWSHDYFVNSNLITDTTIANAITFNTNTQLVKATVFDSSAMCYDTITINFPINMGAPTYIPEVCYITYDSSLTSSTNQFQVVFQKNNWFNNHEKYYLSERTKYETSENFEIRDSLNVGEEGVFQNLSTTLPLDTFFYNYNTDFGYAIELKTTCGNNVKKTYKRPILLNAPPTIYPDAPTLLQIYAPSETGLIEYYIFSREVGQSWQLRYSNFLNQLIEFWTDISTPIGNSIEYMAAYRLVDNCNPNRSEALAFSNIENSIFNTNISSKETANETFDVTVFPNPANQTLFIQTKMPDDFKNATLIVSTVLGKEVRRINISSNKTQEVEIQDLNSGLYLISLYSNSKLIKNKRFIKY